MTTNPMKYLDAHDLIKALDYASKRTREQLREELDAHASIKYLLVADGIEYEAKVIIQLAYNLKFPSEPIEADAFRGDRKHVAEPLMKLGFDVIEISTDRTFGHIAGVQVGDLFANRIELSEAFVHRPRMAGISGSGTSGADSIVVSGGYIDDEDDGYRIVYTGHGGNDAATKHQIADQVLEGGNLALAISCDEGLPVRVSRGSRGESKFAPPIGFRYDGLYQVTRYWPDTGVDGFRIWRFELHSLEAELPPVEPSSEAIGSEAPEGMDTPVQRLVAARYEVARNQNLARWVKELHDWTCQMCGERVTTPVGGYAEAAHITPIGSPHNGPDQLSNLLCLCPNCHKRFDGLARYIDENDDVIDVVSGQIVGRLRRRDGHRVASNHLVAQKQRVILAFATPQKE